MKKTAIVLFIIALICSAVFAYHLLSSKLVTEFSVESVPASEKEDLFYEAASEAGIKLSGIDDYIFLTVSVTARSYTPFSAEWVTFSVNEEAGDVIIVSEKAGPDDITGFGGSSYSVTLMTSDTDGIRSAILNYYILGRNHSIYLSNAPVEDK